MTDNPLRDRVLDWPSKNRVYLTLDLECDYGTALNWNTYEALDAVDRLVELLEELAIPLTCFVQTEVLDERPDAVETLRNSTVETEFHPHSHKHSRRERTTVRDEIERSTRRYRDFFDAPPLGYRFPNGNVKPRDYRQLAEYGFRFDASVFPTWRPGRFNQLTSATEPRYLAEYELFELPFTVYTDLVRIPTALSFCRLLGRPFVTALSRRPPPVLVFNVHMHDLVTPASHADLPLPYRLVYARNDNGFYILERLLRSLSRSEYRFETIGEAYTALRDRTCEASERGSGVSSPLADRIEHKRMY